MTRAGVTTAVATVGLIGSLAGWGWFATEQAREGWWALGQHVAVEPDDQGWAEVDALRVRLTGTERATEIDEQVAPAGYEFLELHFEVAVDGPAPQDGDPDEPALQLSTCGVQVRDAQGRLFEAGSEVPFADPYVWSLTCGTSDPDEDPVPAEQSMLVLVPSDADLVSVRVDAHELPPATFIELPLTP